ncbi:MAG: hypothetical protein ACOZQL_13065 [Myxococcota bacterium]
MTTKPKKCPACERGVLVGKPTREAMPFRHAPAVMPAWPVEVPTCTECGERFLDAKTAKAWDEALEEGLAAHQRRLLAAAVERLSSVRMQREWEKRLGLSPGYLSRLKAGKECSVPLATLLAILAEAPEVAWDQVGRLWSETPPVVSPSVRLVHSARIEAHAEASPGPTPNVSPRMTPVSVRTLAGGNLPEALNAA